MVVSLNLVDMLGLLGSLVVKVIVSYDAGPGSIPHMGQTGHAHLRHGPPRIGILQNRHKNNTSSFTGPPCGFRVKFTGPCNLCLSYKATKRSGSGPDHKVHASQHI